MQTSIDTVYKDMYPGEYSTDDVTDTIDESNCLSKQHNLHALCIVHKRPCIIPEIQLFLMPTSIDKDYKEMYFGNTPPTI